MSRGWGNYSEELQSQNSPQVYKILPTDNTAETFTDSLKMQNLLVSQVVPNVHLDVV
jgi:hypothetical protein